MQKAVNQRVIRAGRNSITIERVAQLLIKRFEIDDVATDRLASSVLVYDGPRWFGVYERFEPVQVRTTPGGPAEVWVVRE